MTWIMWLQDPVLREFAIQAGGGSFFANFTGNPVALINQGFYNNQGLGQSLGQIPANEKSEADLPQNQKSAFQIPGYGNGLNFRILLSCKSQALVVDVALDHVLPRSRPVGQSRGARTRGRRRQPLGACRSAGWRQRLPARSALWRQRVGSSAVPGVRNSGSR